MSEGWIDFDGRQEITDAAFPPVNLPTTGVFLSDPGRNLEGSIGFGAFLLCINSRLLTACTRVGRFRDVNPPIVVISRDKQSGCLHGKRSLTYNRGKGYLGQHQQQLI